MREEYELEVLEKYDIEVKSTRRIRGAFFCIGSELKSGRAGDFGDCLQSLCSGHGGRFTGYANMVRTFFTYIRNLSVVDDCRIDIPVHRSRYLGYRPSGTLLG